MLFAVLAKKAYLRNLQYRGSHALNTVASACFGLIYVSVWQGIGSGHDLGEYGMSGLKDYVLFNQACLWLTVFLTYGLGIEASVRSGQIATDLMRPAHLFYTLMCREWGQIAYQCLYKTVPVYLLYVLAFSMHVPSRPSVWLLTVAALLPAAYISICIQYLIGVCAMWTTESRWLVWVHISVSMLLAGFLIPIEFLPGWLQTASAFSFYPYLQYHPTRIYLGMENGSAIFGSLAWCALFTLACVQATALARRKLEVQGG